MKVLLIALSLGAPVEFDNWDACVVASMTVPKSHCSIPRLEDQQAHIRKGVHDLNALWAQMRCSGSVDPADMRYWPYDPDCVADPGCRPVRVRPEPCEGE